jgi:hypothetical protein
MVTAELATAVPALLLVLVVGVGAVQVGVDQVRCVDAARLAARALARGDEEGPARSLAQRAAPAGSTVAVTSSGPEVTVEVSVGRELAGWRAVTVRGSATAQREVSGAVSEGVAGG